MHSTIIGDSDMKGCSRLWMPLIAGSDRPLRLLRIDAIITGSLHLKETTLPRKAARQTAFRGQPFHHEVETRERSQTIA
jgi:hypothetical protein